MPPWPGLCRCVMAGHVPPIHDFASTITASRGRTKSGHDTRGRIACHKRSSVIPPLRDITLHESTLQPARRSPISRAPCFRVRRIIVHVREFGATHLQRHLRLRRQPVRCRQPIDNQQDRWLTHAGLAALLHPAIRDFHRHRLQQRSDLGAGSVDCPRPRHAGAQPGGRNRLRLWRRRDRVDPTECKRPRDRGGFAPGAAYPVPDAGAEAVGQRAVYAVDRGERPERHPQHVRADRAAADRRCERFGSQRNQLREVAYR